MNEDFTFNQSITTNNSLNLSYLWDSSSIIFGNFIIRVTVVGTAGRTNQGYSEIFTIYNTQITISNPTFSSPSIYKYQTISFDAVITTNYFIDKTWITLKYPNGTSINYSLTGTYDMIFNETSQLGQYNVTFIYANATQGTLFYNDYTTNQYVNFTVLQPLFNLVTLISNCSFTNCTFVFTFDQTCNLNLTINSVMYNSTNNTIHSIQTQILSENTAYAYTYNAVDIYGNNVTGSGNVATKSYAELLYEDSIENQEFFLMIFILAILFILYIISEVFRISMLGTLAGIGLIIYSFTLFTYGTWFFIIMIFAGLVMLARSIFS